MLRTTAEPRIKQRKLREHGLKLLKLIRVIAVEAMLLGCTQIFRFLESKGFPLG